jgi:hypothetical protein
MKNETLIGAIQKLPNEQLDQLVYVIDGIKLGRKLNGKLQSEIEAFKNPELLANKTNEGTIKDEDGETVRVTVVKGGSELFDALISRKNPVEEPEKVEPEETAATTEELAAAAN